MVKVSVPREALEQIMNQYGVDEKTATRAFLNAQDAASETFNRELAGAFDKNFEPPPRPAAGGITIFTPKQIKRHLDKYVIGQEQYKKRVSIAAAYHFATIKHLAENPGDSKVKRFRKKNTITAGPSGSGKTYLVEVLGDLLTVPTLIVDATDYTEAGYVGKSADDMVRELIDLAPGATRKEQAAFIAANGGIIFIDEIDKKAKDAGLIGHDVSREGFQRAVLKLIERKQVSIDNPMSPASQIQEAMDRQRGREPNVNENMISTENILFILGGSFERPHDDLEALIRKRLAQKDGRLKDDGSFVIQGFGGDEAPERDDKYKTYLPQATSEDYIRFGLIPELVGRSPIRTFVNLLSKNDLVRIMTQTEDSILDQYKLEFSLFGVELAVSEDAVAYVAEISENQRTGARALVSVWENILTDFQYELPGSNFTRLKVDRALCQRPKDALLGMLKKSPFVDFEEYFRREHGVALIIGEEAQKYLEDYAERAGLQVSEALKSRLKNASALNYMDIEQPFTITREMVEDEGYFERLFTQWRLKAAQSRQP